MVERGIIMLEPINFVSATTSEEKKNLFEGMTHRSYGKTDAKVMAPNYSIRSVTSVIMNEIIINGVSFIVRYDHSNEHMLTIIDMVNSGYYSSSDDNYQVKIGANAIQIPLADIPSVLRKHYDEYTREVRELMRAYYRKYYKDIAMNI